MLDDYGGRLAWASEEKAREMLARAQAAPVWGRRSIIGVRLIERSRWRPWRPAHRRETRDNPFGVWTLSYIPDNCAHLFTPRWPSIFGFPAKPSCYP